MQIEALKLLKLWSECCHKQVLDSFLNGLITFQVNHKNWRIRFEEIKALLAISEKSDQKTFVRSFRYYYLKGLLDVAFDIRNYVLNWTQNIQKIIDQEEILNLMREVKSICDNKENFYSIHVTSF